MFLLCITVPLVSLRLSAVLAHEAVAPTEVAEGVVGEVIPAEVTRDGDVFHVCIVAQCGAPASINLKNRIVVSPCVPRGYGGAAAPATLAGYGLPAARSACPAAIHRE